MTIDYYENQTEKRKAYLDLILSSDNPRKLIVAGPGTGKTFTFGEVFRKSGKNNNLALTFIRKLVEEMDKDFGDRAEVKTFHAYCKKLLHARNGKFDLIPYLTKIIKNDADILGHAYANFDHKFQTLAESSPELKFYIERGDYYDAVSFNDSVYRLYTYIRDHGYELPSFDQIVIDEYQDFNTLEVAFIEELEKKSPIIIVGDDDQAVYEGRYSSPEHLRKKYHSGNYELFQLPYCSRCPQVIVEATTSFINKVIERGGLKERINRPFIPFLNDKQYENRSYPRIIRATTSTISAQTKFVTKAILNIPEVDICESFQKNYPCVLIVGQKQYLNPLAKKIREQFSNVSFNEGEEIDYSAIDAYKILLKQGESNLGWRILAEFEFSRPQMRGFIKATLNGSQMREILPPAFIEKHEKIIALLKIHQIGENELLVLHTLLGKPADIVISHFYPVKEEENKLEVDKSQPTILLSSFQGCKGLSAGHVFIVGLNDGVVPKQIEKGKIDDIEYCKFIVALTRTRKRCYLISNSWDYNPRNERKRIPSSFFNLISSNLIEDLGYLKSANLN